MRHAADQHEFAEEGRRACGPGCDLITQRCSECGLGRRLRVLDGRIVGVEVQLRAAWQWVDPWEVLLAMPYMLCPDCGGAEGGCPQCRELGIMEIVTCHAGVAR